MFTPRIGTWVQWTSSAARSIVPSPAQDHDDFGVVRHARRLHAEIGGLGVVDDGDFETGHSQLAHRLGHYGSGLPEPGMRHHHRVALGHGILLSIRSHCSLF